MVDLVAERATQQQQQQRWALHHAALATQPGQQMMTWARPGAGRRGDERLKALSELSVVNLGCVASLERSRSHWLPAGEPANIK